MKINLIAFCVLTLWPTVLLAQATKVRVITLGDSITKGVRSGVTAEETFAARLQQGLKGLTEEGIEVEVKNVGIGGERTDQALVRLSHDILALNPAIVTIMYGTNDSWVDQGAQDSRLSLAQYRQNLDSLVGRLKAAGVEPLLMTEPSWGRAAQSNGVGEHPNERLKQYMDACRSVAHATGTLLVDHFRDWESSEQNGIDIGSWTTDQCHPNPEGHRRMADLMQPLLLQMIKQLPQRKAANALHRTVELDIDEQVHLQLTDGSTVTVKLLEVIEQRDSVRNALRQVSIRVLINDQVALLESGNYHLPLRVGPVQIDCPATSGLNESVSASDDPWGLRKRVRLRLWPADSTWLPADQFVYPLKQRWLASATQMSNEPSFVDGGDVPTGRRTYYHYGLDIGGAEGLTEVLAATDGEVVSAGLATSTDVTNPPVTPRADVVYVRDARNWFYRYSHLKSFEVKLGDRLKKGQRIGFVGKEGATAWSHLHFDIKAIQPSGKWGIEDGYAFLWQAYQQQFHPQVIANARPHHTIYAGQKVQLDGSRSWCSNGQPLGFFWQFSDGTTSDQALVQRTYEKAGQYAEVLRVKTTDGHISYDFATVLVIDPELKEQLSPTLHASYWPTQDLRPGDPIMFKARAFACEPLGETWDFGDGTPTAQSRSDGNRDRHAADGYGQLEHRFARAGDYVVTVRHPGRDGHGLTSRLHVHIDDPSLGKQAEIVQLWPSGPPDESNPIGDEYVRWSPAMTRDKVEVISSTRMLANVSVPSISIYRPEKAIDTGTAIVICPGGGYWNLYWELEGEEVAKWLNEHGITGVILKYRVPRRAGEDTTLPAKRPLQDAQRALRLLRSRAKDWAIHPERIGIMGFSAGGHLAIATAANWQRESYAGVDASDSTSARPDFAIAVYPGYLKAKEKFELADGLTIPDSMPPVFLTHGSQDIISSPENSLVMYQALQRAGVPVEMHLYASTSHDFGIRTADRPYADWTKSCLRWLEDQRLLVRPVNQTHAIK